MLKSPGGSPTNTIFGASNLGLRCAYIGCVGNDENGYDYINALRANDIDTYVSIKKGPSAVCYTFITPDGQRSFGLDFGVTKQLEPYEILHSLIEESFLLHFSAYEFRGDVPTTAATKHALKIARESGTRISIDMGDSWLIDQTRESLMELFNEGVDIVFANECEADAFCGVKRDENGKYIPQRMSPTSKSMSRQTFPPLQSPASEAVLPPIAQSPTPEFAMGTLASQQCSTQACPLSHAAQVSSEIPPEWAQFLKYTKILVVKLGANGSLAMTKNKMFIVPSYKVDNVLDTNGAGDNFQAGFLYGLYRGLSLPMSLKCGNFIASKIINQRGAQSKVQISGIEYLL
ncbi:putative Adenosine kinase [Blattamonas nauphoetae]|uniref:Adenosine kinase n=1 Tax=Blattamonas nauphoetae TaxID=2049346 RepID=A0ABQ9Y488_9EUKA|nr:putative Adenosine kinase [Blattamonas nauphoetae]